MSDKIFGNGRALDNGVLHLPRRRVERSNSEERMLEMELAVASHFRDQNEILRSNNRELKEQLQRLTNGVERLVGEMHGVRTGTKERAFARICGKDGSPDLPTVRGEAALWYTHTASTIGRELGFHSSQIGLLLGSKGLNWAGNGDYQEIGRATSISQSKFWHEEVPDLLRAILDENDPGKYRITSKVVLTIFRKWKDRRESSATVACEQDNIAH